jgi:murein L,D-transpeptidase YcbB/YkuD
MMPELRHALLSAALSSILISSAPALAQYSGTPTVPADQFRPRAGVPSAPAQVARPAAAPARAADEERLPLVSNSPEPTFEAGTYDRINAALLSYAAIEVRGGWPVVPKSPNLVPGGRGYEVAVLRQRLAISDDLAPEKIKGEVYDQDVTDAVKRFQARHGLPGNGSVGPQTLEQLNIPVGNRLRQLASSLDRLTEQSFAFGPRHVVVNIPAAYAEVIANGKVERRFVAVVGKPDRPSPTLTTQITAINLNPTWTAPLSIVKKDIIPKMRKDPSYVSRMKMRVLDAQGQEIDPRSVDWSADRAPNFTIRQDSGDVNALGVVRVDMPNGHAVYMHDTPSKKLFNSDYRFHSSGCARIADVRDLAAWVLKDQPGWSRRELDAEIASGRRTTVRLPQPIPVAWVYMTAWAGRDGTVHFRNDVYGHDEPQKPRFMVDMQRPIALSQARTAGFVLQSADPEPETFETVSWADSR